MKHRKGKKKNLGRSHFYLLERERERNILSIRFFLPKFLNSWGWARPRPGTQHPIQLSSLVARTSALSHRVLLSKGTSGESWSLKESWDSNVATPVGRGSMPSIAFSHHFLTALSKSLFVTELFMALLPN